MKKYCGNCCFAGPLSEEAVVCKRFPPTVTKVEGTTISSHWPLISKKEWCGEWGDKIHRLDKALPKMGRTIPSGDAA